MASSGLLRLAALVRTDVSEELSASIIRVIRIGELGTLAVTSNRSTLRRNYGGDTSVPTRATRRHIPENGILHSYRCEILILYGINRLGSAAETSVCCEVGTGFLYPRGRHSS
jgi:hypothetical protein